MQLFNRKGRCQYHNKSVACVRKHHAEKQVIEKSGYRRGVYIVSTRQRIHFNQRFGRSCKSVVFKHHGRFFIIRVLRLYNNRKLFIQLLFKIRQVTFGNITLYKRRVRRLSRLAYRLVPLGMAFAVMRPSPSISSERSDISFISLIYPSIRSFAFGCSFLFRGYFIPRQLCGYLHGSRKGERSEHRLGFFRLSLRGTGENIGKVFTRIYYFGVKRQLGVCFGYFLV